METQIFSTRYPSMYPHIPDDPGPQVQSAVYTGDIELIALSLKSGVWNEWTSLNYL